MTIQIGSYNFDGPFDNTSSLRKQSGVYAILGRNAATDRWIVMDIGESMDLQDRVINHDRKDCWGRQRYQQVQVGVLYCDGQARIRVEQQLRAQFNPPCGER